MLIDVCRMLSQCWCYKDAVARQHQLVKKGTTAANGVTAEKLPVYHDSCNYLQEWCCHISVDTWRHGGEPKIIIKCQPHPLTLACNGCCCCCECHSLACHGWCKISVAVIEIFLRSYKVAKWRMMTEWKSASVCQIHFLLFSSLPSLAFPVLVWNLQNHHLLSPCKLSFCLHCHNLVAGSILHDKIDHSDLCSSLVSVALGLCFAAVSASHPCVYSVRFTALNTFAVLHVRLLSSSLRSPSATSPSHNRQSQP